jgi:hypothetical protein
MNMNERFDKRMSFNKIKTQQIRDALQYSGYLLEQRICPILEKFKYNVITNTPYEDIDSGESRELDADATRSIKLSESEDILDSFEVEILIACKNNHFPIVCFTRKATFLGQFDIAVACCSVPWFFEGVPMEYELADVVSHYRECEYIATQFCTVKHGAGGKNEANHGELYGTLYGLCKATRSKEKEYNEYIKVNADHQSSKEAALFIKIIYPVILFSGDLYECKTKGSRYKIKENDHMVLIHSISSRNMKANYCIDMIKESYLPKYLSNVANETEKMRKLFLRNIKELKENASKNFAEIRNQQTKDRFRIAREQ